MSLLMRRALEPSVQCEKFPKAVVDVYVTVLESGGSVRGRGVEGGCIVAMSLPQVCDSDHQYAT